MSADASITIGADASAATRALEAVKLSTESVANSVKSVSASLDRFSGAWDFLSRVKAQMGALADVMARPAASAERLRVAFKTLTGSEASAVNVMHQLRDFSQASQFNMETLGNTARKLLAGGVAESDVVKRVRQLGDAAAASGREMGELADVYVKAINNGITSETVEAFERAGLPVRKMIAEIEGIDMSAVNQKMADGCLTIEHLRVCMDAATEAGGALHGAADNMVQTFDGASHRLQNNFGAVMDAFASELLPAVTPLINNMADALNATVPICAALGEQLGDWLGEKMKENLVPTIQDAVLFFPELGDAILSVTETITRMVDAVMLIPNVFQAVGESIGQFAARVHLATKYGWEESGKIVDEIRRENDPERQKDRARQERQARFDEMMARQEERREQQRADAEARDAKRRASRQEKRDTSPQKFAMLAAESSSRGGQSAAQKEASARQKILDDEDKWLADRKKKLAEKQSLAERERQIALVAKRDFDMYGKIDEGAFTSQMQALTAGAYTQRDSRGRDVPLEKSVKTLTALRDAYIAVQEAKKEFNAKQTADLAATKADIYALAGQSETAKRLREEENVRKRILELTKAGATAEKARSQALMESKIRGLKEKQKESFTVQSSAAVYGAGYYRQVSGTDVQKSMLNTIVDIYKHLQSNLIRDDGKDNTAAVLA